MWRSLLLGGILLAGGVAVADEAPRHAGAAPNGTTVDRATVVRERPTRDTPSRTGDEAKVRAAVPVRSSAPARTEARPTPLPPPPIKAREARAQAAGPGPSPEGVLLPKPPVRYNSTHIPGPPVPPEPPPPPDRAERR